MAKESPTWTVTINATPDKIWPYIGNLDRHGEWSPKPFAIEWVSGEPNAVGSTFRSTGALPQDKNHSMEGTVLTRDAPKRFSVNSHDKGGEFVNTLDLTPQGEQTKVTRTVEFPPPKEQAGSTPRCRSGWPPRPDQSR